MNVESLVEKVWGGDNTPLTQESLLNLARAAAEAGRAEALGDPTEVGLMREAIKAAEDKAWVIAAHTPSPVARRQFQAKACRLAAIASRLVVAVGFFGVAVHACEIVGTVQSVRKETKAACDDCQLRIEIADGRCAAPLTAPHNVLAVTRRAHNIAPGARVVVEVEKLGASGAYVVVKVKEVRR